jgi:hypothetical protein
LVLQNFFFEHQFVVDAPRELRIHTDVLLMDDLIAEDLEDLAVGFIIDILVARDARQPFAPGRRSLSDWLRSPILFFNATGLTVPAFERLVDWLLSHTDADDGQISLAEKTMLFLHICRKGAGYRETQVVFNRSLSTVSR